MRAARRDARDEQEHDRPEQREHAGLHRVSIVTAMSIRIGQATLGREVKVKSAREQSADRMLEPPVRQKSARIRDHYNELRLDTEDGLAVVFRAYDEGVAYRLEPGLVRGLDYYMRTTFEIVATGLGSQNAVCGGGRYDSLLPTFGYDVPASISDASVSTAAAREPSATRR